MTTGITFTFDGLKITNNAEVGDPSGHPIPGLCAGGEIAGGLSSTIMQQHWPHRRPERGSAGAQVFAFRTVTHSRQNWLLLDRRDRHSGAL